MLTIDVTTTVLYILTGCIAGFSAGLLGVGGGLIIVPVLYFIFSSQAVDNQYLMHMALATSLATIIITSISSTLAHHRKQAVLWPAVLMLTPGICTGAWLGANFASQLDTSLLKPVFGVFELLVAALMISQYQSQRHTGSIRPASGLIGGGFIGALSAVVGIGGGTLTVPYLHWHNIDIKNAIATSAACGLPIAIFATASYIYSSWHLTEKISSSGNMLGFVQLDAFVLIALSSFICAPVGAKMTHKLSARNLKKIFSAILFLLGIKMLMF